MSTPAVQLDGLRATLDPEALANRRLVLTVESARLRIVVQEVARLAPASAPVRPERVEGGEIRLTGSGFTVDVRPVPHPGGRLRLQVVRVRAVGLIPVPASLALGMLRSRLPDVPGLYPGSDDYLEVDLAELVRAKLLESGGQVSLRLPPVRSCRAENGVLEIEF